MRERLSEPNLTVQSVVWTQSKPRPTHELLICRKERPDIHKRGKQDSQAEFSTEYRPSSRQKTVELARGNEEP